MLRLGYGIKPDFLAATEFFSLLQSIEPGSWIQQAQVHSYSPGSKAVWRVRLGHSPPSSVKNAWRCTAVFPICYQGVVLNHGKLYLLL
jgi:hypothetical protein